MDTNKTEDLPKKCFCARCFLPIDEQQKVEIEGQQFHRMCSTCCICQKVPTQLKMFYGHVFCNECFKSHVLSRFRDNPRYDWWMQFAPGVQAQESKPASDASAASDTKRCICTRCLQSVCEADKIDIGGQSFHVHCAKCCACHLVPKENIKIYFGQVFCEDCFNRLILNRNKDNSAEFFRTCFEQMQSNPQFAENMNGFMSGSTSNAGNPLIFMMHGQQSYCRCGDRASDQAPDWLSQGPKKSATPATSVDDSISTWELSFENRTEVSAPESFSPRDTVLAAAEKIEKLTKYLRERDSNTENKKWKKFDEASASPAEPLSHWIDLQEAKLSTLKCPKCLWQCGTIYVNRDYELRELCLENFC
ncbi:hypothetical protein MSG28_015380 [Choristoneura fumiferana]|uniref:Uncharacterized protein n=1 Tax=Choristoneura fumiferana TaxID=7141 RepID=A0ACC0KAY4_CHOFU|nr:hypothetical protein MSG28_015380 [Choristoneura fumiferana]